MIFVELWLVCGLLSSVINRFWIEKYPVSLLTWILGIIGGLLSAVCLFMNVCSDLISDLLTYLSRTKL